MGRTRAGGADFRTKASWRHHRKRKRLARRLGPDGVIAIWDIWGFCCEPSNGRTNGDLSGLSPEDIADEINYPGDPDELIRVLQEPGIALLGGAPGELRVHDWDDHQPYVAGHEGRSNAAMTANAVRWHKNGRHVGNPREGCPLCAASDPESDTDHMQSVSDSGCDPGRTGGGGPDQSGVPPSPPLPSRSRSNTPEESEPDTEDGPDLGDDVTAGDVKQLVMDLGWPEVSPQLFADVRRHAPFTGEEFKSAYRQTVRAAAGKGGTPNGQLLFTILGRLAKSRARGKGGTPPVAALSEAWAQVMVAAAGNGVIEDPVALAVVKRLGGARQLGLLPERELSGRVREQFDELYIASAGAKGPRESRMR